MAVVVDREGTKVELDQEITRVVQYDAGPMPVVTARVLHAERCATYRLEKERAEARRKLRGE